MTEPLIDQLTFLADNASDTEITSFARGDTLNVAEVAADAAKALVLAGQNLMKLDATNASLSGTLSAATLYRDEAQKAAAACLAQTIPIDNTANCYSVPRAVFNRLIDAVGVKQ